MADAERDYISSHVDPVRVEVLAESSQASHGEVGGWGRDPFSRNLMSPTPRRKWYLTTGRRFH